MERVTSLVNHLTVSNPYKPPGRLGEPDLDLQSDPRSNPDLVKILKALQMGGDLGKGVTLDPNDKVAVEAVLKEQQTGMTTFYGSLPNDLPGDATEPEVEEKEVSIDGVDGNKIKLYIFRTKGEQAASKPAVVYFHGGGMTVIDTYVKPHIRWAKSLALKGTVAVLVDFRNSWQVDGKHAPFPAGLNDCAAAVKYLDTHKSELGISKLVVQGESGGGNLSIATALKANREGWMSAISGIYACVPYISGAYHWSDERKLKELPSLKENDGYVLSVAMMTALATWYSPGEGEMENPLAWPYHATEKDLKGLPPTILSMDELDPLRDEGVIFYRKLSAAGVKVTAEVNLGITHGTSLMFRQALPEQHEKALRHIAAFANSL